MTQFQKQALIKARKAYRKGDFAATRYWFGKIDKANELKGMTKNERCAEIDKLGQEVMA